MDLITVALPVYNVEDCVEMSLLSALNQTYGNLEFIIVDDKGTDNSMQIVRKVISTHPRGKNVKIIEYPMNMGLGYARDTAIDAAKGKYLFFMDSDDEIPPDCIQKLSDAMHKTNVDVVSGSYHRVAGNKIIDSNTRKHQIVTNKADIILGFFNGNFPITNWNKLYNVSFLRDNNIRCIYRNYEDTYSCFKMVLHANSCCLIPDITYLYKHREDSITNTGVRLSDSALSQLLCVFRDMSDLIKQVTMNKRLKIMTQKKFFWMRVHNAGLVRNGPVELHHYVNDFLNTAFLKDTYTLQNRSLLLYFIISGMPLFIKKLFLSFYTFYVKLK
jgi:glycosyltransferase involved in cell wall biosynthesis